MGLTESDALVLRTYNLAEADKIVVCLTRAEGLIRAVAKGSRRIKNRFGAALEPFTRLNVSYYHKENQELVSLRHAEIIKSHFDLCSDPQVLAGLAYVADLLIEFSPPHQTNDRLFRMVNACLEATAASPQALPLVLRYFEIWIMKLEGFLSDVSSCCECRTPLSNEVPRLSGSNELLCSKCAPGRGQVLSQRIYLMMCATQKRSPEAFVREYADASTAIQTELADLTHKLIARSLERRPRIQPVLPAMRALEWNRTAFDPDSLD